MTAQYWTITGYDMWRLDKREVFDFKNLNTGEVVTCSSVTEVTDQKFLPVTMPQVKEQKLKKQKVKKTPKAVKSSRRAKSKYKGVSQCPKARKFRAQFWDEKTKKFKHLGTFDSGLLAAAAYQELIGNKKEAKRLRNKYQEGNCRPELPEPQVKHERMFQEDKPKLGEFPSEE